MVILYILCLLLFFSVSEYNISNKIGTCPNIWIYCSDKWEMQYKETNKEIWCAFTIKGSKVEGEGEVQAKCDVNLILSNPNTVFQSRINSRPHYLKFMLIVRFDCSGGGMLVFIRMHTNSIIGFNHSNTRTNQLTITWHLFICWPWRMVPSHFPLGKDRTSDARSLAFIFQIHLCVTPDPPISVRKLDGNELIISMDIHLKKKKNSMEGNKIFHHINNFYYN